MNIEQLLRSISKKIKDNSELFKNNPELFHAIEERFVKAAYDDDEDSDYGQSLWERQIGGGLDNPEQYDDEFSDEDAPQSYDRDPEDEDNTEQYDEEEPSYSQSDEEDTAQERAIREWQSQQQQKAPPKQEKVQADPTTQQPVAEKPTAAASGSRSEWSAKSSYAPHHVEAIKKFISQGYSPREAERLAGAHDILTHDQIISRGIKPSEPSSAMLQNLKEAATGWLSNHQHKTGLLSDPSENPVLHLSSNKNKIMSEVGEDLDQALEEYNKSIAHITDPKEKTKLIIKFKHDFARNNPQHSQKKIEAVDRVSQIAKENNKLRNEKRQEAEAQVATAGMSSGESADDLFSFQGHDDASSVQGTKSIKEGAAQSAGGIKEDEGRGTNVNTKVDPALKISQANPEFVKELQQKIVERLAPEQLSRLKHVQGIKKNGGN